MFLIFNQLITFHIKKYILFLMILWYYLLLVLIILHVCAVFCFPIPFYFISFSFLGVVLCTILLSFPYNVTLLFSVVFFCINTTIAQYCFLVFFVFICFFCLFAVLLNTKNIPTVILICLFFLFVFYAFPVYFFSSVCVSLCV